MTALNWLGEMKLFPAGATFFFFCLWLYLMQMKVPDFQPSRRRRHNHAVDRCMLPIQPSPIKLPSLSAPGTFRARAREICVLAGAFENTANSLFTYYSLQITFVPFLNVSPPQFQRKKPWTRKFLRICFDLSFLFFCSPLHLIFYSQFCCLLISLSFVISQKICLQCCKT